MLASAGHRYKVILFQSPIPMSKQSHAPSKAKQGNSTATVPSTAPVLQLTQLSPGLLDDVIQESSADYCYQQGKTASLKSDWALALHNFEQCLRLEPNHWRGALQKASAHVALKQGESSATALLQGYGGPYGSLKAFSDELNTQHWQAIDFILKTQYQPSQNYFDAMLARALVYRVTQPFMEARKYATELRRTLQAIAVAYSEQTNESVLWHRLSADVWNLQFEYKKALVDYNQAVDMEPTYALTYLDRAKFKRLTPVGDDAGAMIDFNKAIELSPAFIEAYCRRGLTKNILGDLSGALADYDFAVHLDPNHSDAYYGRQMLKDKMGDYEGALADCERVVELDPMKQDAYFKRCIIKQLQDYKGALIEFDRLISRFPKSLYYSKRAKLKHDIGEYEGALSDYALAIEAEPIEGRFYNRSCGSYYSRRADVKYHLGNYTGALVESNCAIKLAPDLSSLFKQRGDINRELNDYAEAMSSYNRAIEVDTKYYEAYIERAALKAILGDITGARADRKRGLRLKRLQESQPLQ